jgi:membrane protein
VPAEAKQHLVERLSVAVGHAVDDFGHARGRFKAHRTGRNSALVAHYGFMSVFPLLLVFTTVLGFVLQGNSDIRQRILDSAFNRIPMVGQQLESAPEQLKGSVAVLIIGLFTALWAGLRAFNVLQTALDDIAEVPLAERPNLVRTRARSLIGVLLIGGSQVGAALLSGLIAISGVGWLNRVLLLLGTISLNIGVLAATYRWLCSRQVPWRHLAPGAIGGGIVFTVLQILGATIVARAISRATPVYGNFASVIGLLTWLSLHALVALGGAELNFARRN